MNQGGHCSGMELPADAEIHIPGESTDITELHDSGVYCLEISRPDDPTAAWDETHDTRPEYWPQFLSACEVWYVGSAKDVLSRLEDHRDGERVPVLLEICEVTALRNIWWCESNRRTVVEAQVADLLRQQHPSVFVHQR